MASQESGGDDRGAAQKCRVLSGGVLLAALSVVGCGLGDGESSTACSVRDNGDGAALVSCPDGRRLVVDDGSLGAASGDRVAASPSPGPSLAGTSCRIAVESEMRWIRCDDGTEVLLGPVSSERRHFVLMIGDGMQMAHAVAASRYLYGMDDDISFLSFPVQTFATTWDVTTYDQYAALFGADRYDPSHYDPRIGYDPDQGGPAPYPLVDDTPEQRAYFLPYGSFGPHPDSASTATAMSTGIKTDSQNLNWLPGGVEQGALETITERLRRTYGMAIGVVSTTPFSHATPAGFLAHNPNRFNYLAIASEVLLTSRPDVLITSGYGTEGGYYQADDLAEAQGAPDLEYVERQSGVTGADALNQATNRALRDHKRLFGLFGSDSQGGFESPIPTDTPGAPSVEPGSSENPTLAQASVAALRVLSENPSGFFLMIEQGSIDWANHANDFKRMIGNMWDLDQAVKAVVSFVDQPGDDVDWSNTTLVVTADHANSYLRLPVVLGKGDLPTQSEGNIYPDGDVTYGSSQHTNELVTVSAMGMAAPALRNYADIYRGLNIIDDSDLHDLELQATAR